MRSMIIAGLLTAGLAYAGQNDYEEVRDLSLNAAGIDSLAIEARAGSLEINGVSNSDTIVVKAIVQVADDDDDARKRIESDLVLTLKRDGNYAELKGYFEDSGWLSGNDASVRLEVTVPERMALNIKDGSGSAAVHNLTGDINFDDGSGSIEMSRVGGTVTIHDGSGSISAGNVGGDLSVVDGSGSLSISDVKGDVTIDDGSGGITVSGVTGNLTILNEGSGSLDVEGVQGEFRNES